MTHRIGLAALLILLASAASSGRAPGELTIDALVDTRHPSNPVWSPDGSRLAFVWDQSGVQNLFVVDTGATGPSTPRALTVFDGGEVGPPFWSVDGSTVYAAHDGDLWKAPVTGGSAAPVWTTPETESGLVASPDRSRVAFLRRGDLWVRTLTSGQETQLTSTPATESGPAWSPDGVLLAFSSAVVRRHEHAPEYSGAKILYTWLERTPADLHVVAATGGTPTTIAASPFNEGPPRWVDNGRLTFVRTSGDTTTREIVVADARTGAGTVVLREVDEKWWSIPSRADAGPFPSPDGKWMTFLSDRDGWDHVYVLPVTGGEPVQLTSGTFEAWRPAWSPDSTRIAFDANLADHPGQRHIGVITLASADAGGAAPPRPAAVMITSGRGTNTAALWSPDGRRLVYQHTDPQSPADLFVSAAAAPSGAGRRLTDSLPASIDRAALVEPEMVRYDGPDGQKVPAFLFVPRGLDRSKRHAAIIWIHGDGQNQNYDGWHVERNYAVYYSYHQYLLQKGYVVLAPDYRGSIGYGRAWRQGVFRDVGGKDYEDAALGARYLGSLPYVDASRIGVWGLSYGGFFTLQALVQAPTTFAAGVNVAGVVDYRMYYEDPYKGAWTYGRMRAPEDNPAAYDVASPLSRMDRLQRPLLTLHGTADVNVPYLHSVRLIDTLLKLGKQDVEFMAYPGEFHYFTRAHVLRDAWTRVERFFDRHLKR